MERVLFDGSAYVLFPEPLHSVSFSIHRISYALDKSKPRTRKILVPFDCAQAFNFNNGFWTCIESVTTVTNPGPRSYFSQRSCFLGADQKIHCPWKWNCRSFFRACVLNNYFVLSVKFEDQLTLSWKSVDIRASTRKAPGILFTQIMVWLLNDSKKAKAVTFTVSLQIPWGHACLKVLHVHFSPSTALAAV